MMSRGDIQKVITDTQLRINRYIESEAIKNELFNIFETLGDEKENTNYSNAKKQIKNILKRGNVDSKTIRELMHHIKQDFSLRKRIKRLELMQNLFRYWHVVHLPFAILMLLIMIIHIAVTLLFGYTWIF
jgi:mRNA-degrading endonuclease YafQ of YafQ-DinJ toxin-antitoxin module